MSRLVVLFEVLSMLAAAAVASGRAAEANPEQDKAIAAIKELGGKVTVDQNGPDKPVVDVSLAGTDATDAELERLKGLTKLRWLNLWNTRVTDAGLEQLQGLTDLELLHLGRTQVTDAGLKHLEGLTSLEWLGLEQTEVTDAGVGKLQKALPDCRIELEAGPAPTYVMPQGSVSELTGFVQRLAEYRPKNPANVVQYRVKFRPALQAAAEQILKLEKDHGSEAYESARFIVLSNRVYWLARAVPAEQRRIIAAVKEYLDEQLKRGGAQVAVTLAAAAAKAIQQTGQWDWAAETYESFAERAKTSDDERVTAKADSMLASARRLRQLSDKTLQSSAPAITPRGKMTPIDLSEKANAGNTEWAGGSYHGNGLAELPKGDQEFCGVKFRTTERLMQLGCEEMPWAPAKITGIAVNRKLRRLYVLQASQYAYPGRVPEGTALAAYKVHYADGSQASVPVAFGEDVRDWFASDEGMPVTRGRVVWTGGNSAAERAHTTLRLYLGVWENPHTERTVTTLDFVKTGDTKCAPLCLAITAEE